MKLLVTGGLGFIGSNYILHVLQQDSDIRVVNVDALTYAGNERNVERVFGEMLDDRYFFYHADITDLTMMEHIVKTENPEWIINFAAESHVSRAAWGAAPFINSNILGVYRLLCLCHKYKINYFQISTDEVYGSIDEGEVDESAALRPTNLYSASKAAADLFCHAFASTWDVRVWITRSVNNFGPYQHPEKLIPLAISNLLEGKQIPLYGGGHHIRPWIHVEDNSSAIEVIRRGADPGIYNVACGDYVSVKEIAAGICSVLGRTPSECLEIVEDRPGNDFRYGIASDKIRSTCNWAPKFSIEKDLEGVVQWYVENKAWWRQIKATLGWQEYYNKIHLPEGKNETGK